MPIHNYIKIFVDNSQLELKDIENLPLSISYSLEDRENFQLKKSSTAFNLLIPATLINDKISNCFHKAGSEDLTTDGIFKGNRRGVIEINSQELLVGKAFLVNAEHDAKPTEYEYSFYGNNGDWIIDLKESTLHDFVKDIVFIFSKTTVMDSWAYDGTNINLPYVFAPVRYGLPMDTYEEISGGVVVNTKEDYNMKPIYMKPSLSKYWIIYKAFRSLGYRIQSDFLDSAYFRRQVMPWTWGNFLYSDGTRLDNLDFLAKSAEEVHVINISVTTLLDVKATNDTVNGGFDNNGVYEYVNPSMKWTYLPTFNYGLLTATFHLAVWLDAVATANSDVEVRAQWFKNGVKFNHGNDNGNGTLLLNLDAPTIGRRAFVGIVEDFAIFNVNPSDVIECKIYVHTFKSGAGIARLHLSIDAFELDYFTIPLGGTINFENYAAFKKFKFLDYLAGVIDEYNLCIQTDSVTKTVYIEPMHPYSLVHDQSIKTGGYYNGKHLDWSSKQDLTKKSKMELFSDFERELNFKYKNDTNDGGMKVIQDRNVNTVALAKYVFPTRFKAGKREIENRFFSASMHYDVVQWKTIAADYPQMMCLIPENIANTSRDEAQNTFEPKSAYYKGLVNNMGWMFDGEERTQFPLMFAVYYRDGGEDEPILSYCDELIGSEGSTVMGRGLLRRFYLQRLEIMRNGQFYKTYIRLNNNDIANILHREHVILQDQKWEVVEINGYKPLKRDSTEVYLKKHSTIKHA